MEDRGQEASPLPSPCSSSKSSMTTISRHYFGGDSSFDSRDFYIDIIENMREEYGMFVWPCSIILAEYVWKQSPRFSGSTVLELGAGTSLPGLVAAKLGANVILTDNSNRPEVLDNIRRICNLNKLDCSILGHAWGEWDAHLFNLHPQIVLGADVFYDSTDFEDLFAMVTFLLRNSPGSVFITAYHNRRLKCVKLLDGFSVVPRVKTSSLQGNIQLVEILLDDQRDKPCVLNILWKYSKSRNG